MNFDARAPETSQFDSPLRTIFLDFEASSLDPEGWPIEIGLSWIEGEEVETEARLIAPHEDWPMSAWSEKSAAVHHISLDLLRAEGAPAAEVAGWYLQMTEGASVVSDAPEFEQRWLRRLLETLPGVDIQGQLARIEDMHEVVGRMLDDAELDRFYERLERSKAPHRAGPDSARLARALLKVSQGR